MSAQACTRRPRRRVEAMAWQARLLALPDLSDEEVARANRIIMDKPPDDRDLLVPSLASQQIQLASVRQLLLRGATSEPLVLLQFPAFLCLCRWAYSLSTGWSPRPRPPPRSQMGHRAQAVSMGPVLCALRVWWRSSTLHIIQTHSG